MFEIANCLEAALWVAMGLGFLIRGGLRRDAHRSRCVAAGLALICFGASDVVEVWTGAWWRPWWLLVWKAACLSVVISLVVDHYRRGSTESSRRD